MDTCEHPDFAATVSCARILDSPVWYADLTLRCAACGREMQFIGFPMGLSPGEPMVNVSGTELRIPFRPYTEEEAFRRFGDNPPSLGFRITASKGEA